MNVLDRVFLKAFKFKPAKRVGVKFHTYTRNLPIIIDSLKPNQKVLDVGCGLGFTGEHLYKKGFSVTGLELDSRLVEKVNKYTSYNVHNDSADNMPFENEFFDSAIFMYVMHHIPPQKHLKVMQETARVLKKNGKVIIVEPDTKSQFDFVWDKIFFSKSFFGYFNLKGKYKLTKKGAMRFFEIKKEEIENIVFEYEGEVE